MVLGLGTGSTAALAVEAIGHRVPGRAQGRGDPDLRSDGRAVGRLGIPLVDFADHAAIDLTIDGADAVDRRSLDLIKGLGGALLREKIVAAASKRMIVIVDESKLAGEFGTRCPVPVETVQFGWQATGRRLACARLHDQAALHRRGQFRSLPMAAIT